MKIILILFAMFTFIKTISYGIYEFKVNKNKPGAISIIGLALGSCILITVMLCIK